MSNLTIRRLRTADAVLKLVEHRQPLSVDIVDRVNRTGERTHWKAHLLQRDEDFCGLFFQYRLCRGKWEAILILDEAVSDPGVERFINRAQVWSIGGPGDHVATFLERLPRLTRLTKLEMFYQRNPPAYWAAMPGAQERGIEHVDQLVEFFSHHERFGIPTMAGIREFVGLALKRGPAVVMEEDGEIVAGVLLGAATDEWISLDGMTVRPDRRGVGLSTVLLSGATRIWSDGAVGMCGLRATTNPAGYEPHASQQGWFAANLAPPKRFRGHQRLRVLARKFQEPSAPWSTTYIRPEYRGEGGQLRDRPEDRPS
jgi:GNAT superfamily N-acetyltransferase